jgi:hypothetical protein
VTNVKFSLFANLDLFLGFGSLAKRDISVEYKTTLKGDFVVIILTMAQLIGLSNSRENWRESLIGTRFYALRI